MTFVEITVAEMTQDYMTFNEIIFYDMTFNEKTFYEMSFNEMTLILIFLIATLKYNPFLQRRILNR
jgi:hypothetical protein